MTKIWRTLFLAAVFLMGAVLSGFAGAFIAGLVFIQAMMANQGDPYLAAGAVAAGIPGGLLSVWVFRREQRGRQRGQASHRR